MRSVATPAHWFGFVGAVLVLLALDLFVFHRKAHEIRFKEALGWSVFWLACALGLNLFVQRAFGTERALEFFTGYVIEEALSVDNLFVIFLVFESFAVPAAYRHRVLYWGILGAQVMRAVFIFAGAALLQQFSWIIYLFGAVLLITAVRLVTGGDDEPEPQRNPLFRLFRKVVPATTEYSGSAMTVVRHGRWLATPLLAVLVAVEITDLLFAVDSIPAIFAVTTDPFIVFTSNICAVLGLRSLFFVVASVISKLEYLNIGLSLVLAFVGLKMLVAHWIPVPISWSLGVVGFLIACAAIASLLFPPKPEQDRERAAAEPPRDNS